MARRDNNSGGYDNTNMEETKAYGQNFYNEVNRQANGQGGNSYPAGGYSNGMPQNSGYADGNYYSGYAPGNSYPNNAYQGNGYQNNAYQNSSYQNNSYPNNAYQGNGYQNNGYPNNVYQGSSYPNNAYQDNGYQDGAYQGENGYEGYQDDQDYDDGYPDDGGYDDYSGAAYGQQQWEEPPEQAYNPPPKGQSMASRATGKANNEIYGRPPRRTVPVPANSGRGNVPAQPYNGGYTAEPPRKKRRKKKHHGFLIFLIILILLCVGGWFMLFRAPTQYTDGIHTRDKDVYNIMMCATDASELRTDTIMILTIDSGENTTSLTTVPRDTIIDGGVKLNSVYATAGGGADGAEALMDELQTLLGFRPDGYLIVDYEVFKDVVNAVGGVTFDVPMDITIDEYTFPKGEMVFDGDEALALCRFRYGYAMQDIQRQYVQQSFIKAIVKECVQPSKLKYLPKVYKVFMDGIVTDLSQANIRYIAMKAVFNGGTDIQQNTLPGEGVTYGGASCFGLYGQSVVDLINEVMNPFEEDITIDDVYILTVSDGQLVKSTGTGIAFDPSTYDYG